MTLIKHIKRIIFPQATASYARKFWTDPSKYGKEDIPDVFIEFSAAGSIALVEIMNTYANKESSILEIGCNAGRNLNYLYTAGYANLCGIEISPKAIAKMEETYPDMASKIRFYNSPVEDIISRLKDNQFDVVFTMGVLMHLPYASDWIMSEIVRIASKFLITIESEHEKSFLHFHRDYGKIFEGLGMLQVREPEYGKIKDMETYTCRIFRKQI